eukprot:16033004-Heterocapsa_arctica.AAC.1
MYTHKRYCKALKEQKQEDSLPASASVAGDPKGRDPLPPAPPPPGLLQRGKIHRSMMMMM